MPVCAESAEWEQNSNDVVGVLVDRGIPGVMSKSFHAAYKATELVLQIYIKLLFCASFIFL